MILGIDMNWWNVILLCYPLYGCVRLLSGDTEQTEHPKSGKHGKTEANAIVATAASSLSSVLWALCSSGLRLGYPWLGSMVRSMGDWVTVKCEQSTEISVASERYPMLSHWACLNLRDTRLPKLSNHQDMKIKSRRCSAMCGNQWGWGLRTLAMLLNSNLFGHKNWNQIHKFCKLLLIYYFVHARNISNLGRYHNILASEKWSWSYEICTEVIFFLPGTHLRVHSCLILRQFAWLSLVVIPPRTS